MPTSATLLDVLWYYPVAVSLASHITAGDLLRLSRVNTDYRAILHNFSIDKRINEDGEPELRQGLYLGLHQTKHWVNLKERTIWSCGSPKHTKGSLPRYCRYCSIPICESCIVRDAFKKSERTYLNRTRFLCRSCWGDGKPHRAYRIGDAATSQANSASSNPYAFIPEERELCACTVKDGWVCVGCKDKQNAEAIDGGFKYCFGEGCQEPLEDDKDRRRICLWCDRPMIKGRATLESRAAYDRWCLDRALEDRKKHRLQDLKKRIDHSKVFKSARISRRDLRKLRDQPSLEDDDGDRLDEPCLLASLAIVDYGGIPANPPSHESLSQSLEGKFHYNEDFLFQFKRKCRTISEAKHEEIRTRSEGLLSVNTNLHVKTIDPGNFSRKDLVIFDPLSRTFMLNKDRKHNQLMDVQSPAHAAPDVSSRPELSRKRSFGQRFVIDSVRKRQTEEFSRHEDSANAPEQPLQDSPSSASSTEPAQVESSQISLVTRERRQSTGNSDNRHDRLIPQGSAADIPYSRNPVNANTVSREEDALLNSDDEYDDNEMMEAVLASLTQADNMADTHEHGQNEDAMSDDSGYVQDVIANLEPQAATIEHTR